MALIFDCVIPAASAWPLTKGEPFDLRLRRKAFVPSALETCRIRLRSHTNREVISGQTRSESIGFCEMCLDDLKRFEYGRFAIYFGIYEHLFDTVGPSDLELLKRFAGGKTEVNGIGVLGQIATASNDRT